jgi:Polysaccharide deacetylase
MSERSSAEPVVFLRCDDVAGDTPGLAAVHDVVAALDLPCAFACIPARLTAEAVKRLTAGGTTSISLHQHGLTHSRITPDGVDHEDELVGYRTLEAMREAIERGRRTMIDLAGPDVDLDTFTPPRHRYTEHTVEVLRALGVRRLSAGVYFDRSSRLAYRFGRLTGRRAVRGRGLSRHDDPAGPPYEVSTSVNVDLARDGSPRPVDPVAVLTEIDAARRFTATVGLLLHHELYTDEPERAAALHTVLSAVAERYDVVDLRELPRRV